MSPLLTRRSKAEHTKSRTERYVTSLSAELMIPQPNNGKEVGKRWERDGKEVGKRWGKDGKEVGKRWGKMGKRWEKMERYGEKMGKRWGKDGKDMVKRWERDGGWERGGEKMGKKWERGGEKMGKKWERGGEKMGKRWERGGEKMGKRWERLDAVPASSACISLPASRLQALRVSGAINVSDASLQWARYINRHCHQRFRCQPAVGKVH